jgi:protein-S-isoprenylcysteine O-methyltransferase Ste14
MRRKTGRAANFVPTEPIGRVLRLLWQPVVWVWIAQPFAAAFVDDLPMIVRPLRVPIAFRWLAALITWAAFAATRVCWRRMGKSWRMGIDPTERTALVVTGLYAFVRHPIYALSSVMMIATVIAVPTPLMIVVGVIHCLLLQWEARREERHLAQAHGEPYERYCHSVGRFVPRSTRRYSPAASSLEAAHAPAP